MAGAAAAALNVKFKKLKIKQQKMKVLRSGSGAQGKPSSPPCAAAAAAAAPAPSLLSSLSLTPDGSGVEFAHQPDLLLASLLWAIDTSVRSTQTPLPPFLVPDHFKSSSKLSLKGSTSGAFLPCFLFPVARDTLIHALTPSAAGERALASVAAAVAAIPVVPVLLPPAPATTVAPPAAAAGGVASCVQVPLPLPSWIKVKEYAPLLFACLRDKVYPFSSRRHLVSSLLDATRGPPSRAPFVETRLAKQEVEVSSSILSGGKHVMYASADEQVHVKAIEGSDVEGLLSLLKSLHPYLVQRKGSKATVDSLLPHYLAVFRLLHAHQQHARPVPPTGAGGAGGALAAGEAGGGGASATTATGAASLPPSSVADVAESATYLLLVRNPIACTDSFFPIHDSFTLAADGVVGRRSRRATPDKDFVLVLKKEDADRLLANLESDLRFLSAHLLTGYTLSVGIHSIDEWERELQVDPEEGAEESDDQVAQEQQQQQLQHQSLVIDPLLHPFAVPSPFVGVESRASSRPSLAGSCDTADSGLPPTTTCATAHSQSQSQQQQQASGRFVYFVGVNDLLPLSASFSSKELDLEKKKQHRNDKKSKRKGAAGGEEGLEAGAPLAPDDMGKKESAREYARQLAQQVKRRIRLLSSSSPSASADLAPDAQ